MGIYLPLLILSLTVAPLPIATARTTAAPPPYYPYSTVNAIGGFIFLVALGAVLITCIVTACIICLCCCGNNTTNRTEISLRASVAAASIPFRLHPRGGLDPAVLKSFPILNYSEIKQYHKISNSKGSALSCAVCVSEFGDNERLRLLPKCDHAFHPECIDPWLASHSTCPICRANLSLGVESNQSTEEVRNRIQNIAIYVDENEQIEVPEPGERVMRMFPRPHSTGHSLVRLGEDCERLPAEEVRRRLDRGGMSDRWSFMTPPFSFRTDGSLRSAKVGVVEGDLSPFEYMAGKSEQMPSRPPV